MLLISANPNQLHIYNAAANTETVVALPEVPTSLSVSPDGLHVAVGLTTSAAYVNLQTAAIQKTFSNLTMNGYTVVLGPTYLYLFPTYVGNITSIELATGIQTSIGFDYLTGGRYNPVTQSVYSGASWLTEYTAAGAITSQ